MIAVTDMKPISIKTSIECPSAEHVSSGLPIPKPIRVSSFSPEEWESFIEEWASCLKTTYAIVRRYGGTGDLGIDVVGFVNDTVWAGGWDNYQCKRYDHPLAPSDIWIEFGKIIYYSYLEEYPPPRKYYFVASQGIGTTLEKLLANPDKLKEELRTNWEGKCKDKITSTVGIPLEGDLLVWFNAFDFSIFSSKSIVELITGHANTPFHSVRFGGGLPPRPIFTSPPVELTEGESRYIEQLFEAYSDHLGRPIDDVSALTSFLRDDFLRQRERFYHAEYLRNYARDNVPEGTFERLKDEVFHAVIEICNNDHRDGLGRMRATLSQAGSISTASNPLSSVVQVQDQQGICHHLANKDRLIWVPDQEEVPDDSTV